MAKYLLGAFLASLVGALFASMTILVAGFGHYFLGFEIDTSNSLLAMFVAGGAVGGLVGLAQPWRFVK